MDPVFIARGGGGAKPRSPPPVAIGSTSRKIFQREVQNMAAADRQLAQDYGVSADVIEQFRRGMTEGEHFTRTPLGQIVYLEAGLIAVRSALGLEKKEEGAAEVPPPPAATISLLVITRVHPNPHYVTVLCPTKGPVTIRVRDNRKLAPRVKLRCQLHEGTWACLHHGFAPQTTLLAKTPNASREA